MKDQVFISYSSDNHRECSALKDILSDWGYSYWVDLESIPGSSRWAEEITVGIKNSKAFLLLISASSMNSVYVSRELALAVEYKIPIIPIRLTEDNLTAEFTFFLAGTHYVRRDKENELKDALELAFSKHTQQETSVFHNALHYIRRKVKANRNVINLMVFLIISVLALNIFSPPQSIGPIPHYQRPIIAVQPFRFTNIDPAYVSEIATILVDHFSNDHSVAVRPYRDIDTMRYVGADVFGKIDSVRCVISGMVSRTDSGIQFTAKVISVISDEQLYYCSIDKLPEHRNKISDTLASIAGEIVMALTK